MKITLKINPDALMRLYSTLDEKTKEACEEEKRYAEYEDSDDEWRREIYHESIKKSTEFMELMDALYRALDESETKTRE